MPSTLGACSGGCWSLLNDVAIDSACVIDYVSKTRDFVSNNDVEGGVMLLTSSGDISKADGRGDTSFQSLARHVDTGDLLVHKYETGSVGTTHVHNSKQDLLSSSFLSRHGMVPVQDHENPRVILSSRPGFEITCYEVNRLWFMPLCVWGKGCDNCQKCQAVKRLTCWDDDGNLMKFVHTDNVRFGTLPVPGTKVAALHTARVKSMAADDRRKEKRAITTDGSSSHLGRQLILLEFGDLMQVLKDERSSLSRPSFEEGNMSNLACSNQSSTQHVSHVMALQGTGDQDSPHSQGRAVSSTVHADTAEQERRVQEQAKLGIIARVSTPPRVPVRGGPCKDALTNFDMNLFPNLKRLSNGKTNVLMTKEERQALKLRELYCDPKTFPHESLILEGDLLVEYKSPQLSSQAPSSSVESEGYDDWDQLFPEKGENTSPPPAKDEATSKQVGIYSDNVDLQEDQASLFQSDDDTEDEDLEDRVASTDEEYKELVEVQQRKLLPKLTDSEIRQAAEENVKSTVIRDDDVEEEDGVSVQEFIQLTDSTLPRSNSDESLQDLEHQKMRRRSQADSGVEPARLCLGMKVSRDYEKQTITLSTPALIEAMVKDLEEQGHISAKTVAKQRPMSGTRLEELQDKAEALDEKSYPYRSVVGICLHLSRTTRPDIALAVSELSRYVTCYGQQHIKAANWLALYLKGTVDLGITYHVNLPDHLRNKMTTFSDADWAGDMQARKSRSGYIMQMNLGPTEWYTKGQTIMATSSCMSETTAAVEAAKAIVSTRSLLFELGYRQPGSSRLYVDNEATVLNANGTNQSKRSKHFQIRTELLRVFTDLGRLHVFKIDTDLNISDLHTKPLLGTKFTEMRDMMMGIVPDVNMLHYS